jgi:hypothetical protein
MAPPRPAVPTAPPVPPAPPRATLPPVLITPPWPPAPTGAIMPRLAQDAATSASKAAAGETEMTRGVRKGAA